MSIESVLLYIHIYAVHVHMVYIHIPTKPKARMGRRVPSLRCERKKGKSRSEERKRMTETLPQRPYKRKKKAWRKSGKEAAKGAACAVLSTLRKNRYLKK